MKTDEVVLDPLSIRLSLPGGLLCDGDSEGEKAHTVLLAVGVRRAGHTAVGSGGGPISCLPVRGPAGPAFP